ncbi:LpqB family beta-propeller domain-containing protein [Aeromicrobium sp.]|uniref:LpqB family beta-propeller domain-containing protein n=1 Tax=Aeromicrobium sp. TaxID=1871063 RepID=UPI00199FC34F|nr:LpqB family beta-propeller domain-containing protein [Aeromicrobium sp.]MBC7632233.1 GerMN domain-containing protein [Aeromicrobium sp.]
MRTSSRRRAVLMALVAGFAMTASACAGIPTSGPVSKVADDSGFGESTVRYSPARPLPGASPQQVVRGYLDAMLAFPASSGTVSTFLTPGAAKTWKSLAGVRVYSQSGVLLSGPSTAPGAKPQLGSAAPVVVRLGIVDNAQLDQQGHYTRRVSRSNINYRLQLVDGEWRISNPQPGLLVTSKFFTDYFRQLDIYFFDRPGERLVPDPVHLAVGDRLPTALISSLARGAAGGSDVMRTFVPGLRSLSPSVPVNSDGVADVEFDADLDAVNESSREHLSAQIIWTLRQVPGISAVRVFGGDTALNTGGDAAQSIESWGAYGPSVAKVRAFALAGDKVIQINDDSVEPLTGAWGRDARGATKIAVSDDGVAGVLAARSQVRVTNRKGGDVRTFGGYRLIDPRWDDDGGLWMVDRASPQTRVRRVVGGAVQTLDTGSLATLDVRVFALSPDASRYAVTVDTGGGRSAIYVGTIRRDAKDRVIGLGEPVRVFITAARPRSATWTSGTELSFLADSNSGVQVYTAAIDGSATTGGASGGGALLPDVRAGSLVVGSGTTPTQYATDARRRLWNLVPGRSWKLLDTTGVTGLTSGR